MNNRIIPKLALALIAAAATGCATTPIPADKLSRSTAAIKSAETLDAERDPDAALHLKLAHEQLATGKKLLMDAENERAGFVLERSEADAIAARELARAKIARLEAEKTREAVEKEQTAIGGAQ